MAVKYTTHDFIRVMNAVYESGLAHCICPEEITKDEFFLKIGNACGHNLLVHYEELRAIRQEDGLANELRVFEDMISVVVKNYMKGEK